MTIEFSTIQHTYKVFTHMQKKDWLAVVSSMQGVYVGENTFIPFHAIISMTFNVDTSKP